MARATADSPVRAIPIRRPAKMSPYDHSKMVVEIVLAKQAELGSGATIKDTCRALDVYPGTFHSARRHMDAVDTCDLNHWLPREEAIAEWKRSKPAEGTSNIETRRLIEGALKVLIQSTDTLGRFDASILSGYLNMQTPRRRYRVRQALRQLTPWLAELDRGLR